MNSVLMWPKASFRGAEFHVEGHGRAGGRRGPTHEYPGKEESYAEDMGAKAKRFSVSGYVAERPGGGGGYKDEYQALCDALDKSGAGELVHPSFGAIRVIVRDWSAEESKQHIGFVIFRMALDLSAPGKYPSVQRHPAASAAALAESARETVLVEFERRFVLKGKPDYLHEDAVSWIEKIIDAYDHLSRVSGLVKSNLVGLSTDLAVFLRKAGNLDDSGGIGRQLLGIPRAIANSFEAIWRSRRNYDGTYRGISTLRGGGPVSPRAVYTLMKMFEFGTEPPAVPFATAARRQQLDNQAAIVALTRQAAVIEAARVAPSVDWQTRQEAEEARDRLIAAIDHQCEITPSDAVYMTMRELRSLVTKSVPPEGGRLPSVVQYTSTATIPALVLSYRLYGACSKADELTALNSIPHAGFVPGNRPLQVLSNG